MEHVGYSRDASDLPGEMTWLSVLFQVQLLAGNSDVNHHSELSHGGCSGRLMESFHPSGSTSTVKLRCRRLRQMRADTQFHLDLNDVRGITDLEHVVVGIIVPSPGDPCSRWKRTCP